MRNPIFPSLAAAVFLLSLLFPPPLRAQSGGGFKANLDLPFDRYLPAAEGYDSEPDVLLAGQIELEAAVGLAVNGDIYVVLSSGGVRRFQNGADAGFALGGIDAPIEAANDVESVPATGEIYLFQSNNLFVTGLVDFTDVLNFE